MTLEAWSILTYSILVLFLILIQGIYSIRTAGVAYGFSNRETPRLDKSGISVRIDNTLDNFKEGALMYLPLALLAVSLNLSNAWTYYAALATIISRLLYIPIYIVGIEKVRTLVWIPSFLAVPAMAFGIYRGLGY